MTIETILMKYLKEHKLVVIVYFANRHIFIILIRGEHYVMHVSRYVFHNFSLLSKYIHNVYD